MCVNNAKEINPVFLLCRLKINHMTRSKLSIYSRTGCGREECLANPRKFGSKCVHLMLITDQRCSSKSARNTIGQYTKHVKRYSCKLFQPAGCLLVAIIRGPEKYLQEYRRSEKSYLLLEWYVSVVIHFLTKSV